MADYDKPLIHAVDNGGNKVAVTVAMLSGGGGGGITPFTLTPTVSTKTNSGTISSGCKALSFANNGNANATLAGGTIPPGVSGSFPPLSGGTYSAIAYDATGTSLIITEIR